MAAIGSDDKVGADLALALRSAYADADYAAIFIEEIGGFGLHLDVECGVAAALLDEEIQEVPLGHEGDEFAVGGKM